MLNHEVFQRDPRSSVLINQGVAVMSDAMNEDERRTLRFELEHFVCEGEYHRGLVRILEAFTANRGQPELPAAWVSGFYGSGKSHLVKMLRFLWTDYTFPEDGATARGLARLHPDVMDLLTEISIAGRRMGGLHAAAGTLGAGTGTSVRLALLGIVFRSKGLPHDFALARFCLWLKREGYFDQVRSIIERAGRDFSSELRNLYVSRAIAEALRELDRSLGSDAQDVRNNIKAQFPRHDEVSSEEFELTLREVLALNGQLPATVIILDEVQQYIGSKADRTYKIQELVQTCSKAFGDRLLFVGTGQTALSGTPNLKKLQGRFRVNVELSHVDVETVIRRVVLAKRQDQVTAVQNILEANAGEIARHLSGTSIAPRQEDRDTLADDYPLLPVRRRFWEHVLRAVDKGGIAGQLRTQLRIVHEALKRTANDPLGTVVPADFLFDEISTQLLQSGTLSGDVHDIILRQEQSGSHGILKRRICALIYLIRSLPHEAGADIGVRASSSNLADLLIQDLATEGARLRKLVPELLEDLASNGTLLKIGDEFSLQTRESSEWESQFVRLRNSVLNDPTQISTKRTQLLRERIERILRPTSIPHGKSKTPRKLAVQFGSPPPML
ncbi:MAG: BREX system P-loop protein BrxC [Bacteroidota bacterium]|nr:BREX system P-loop protein BrxC [Bacteroidota bacterium]